MSALFHRVIVPASGNVGISGTDCNRKSMANVTKSDLISGTRAEKDKGSLTPAEEEKLLVRRAQWGDVSAYEELVRIHQPVLP
jgi:hypothetical protein